MDPQLVVQFVGRAANALATEHATLRQGNAFVMLVTLATHAVYNIALASRKPE